MSHEKKNQLCQGTNELHFSLHRFGGGATWRGKGSLMMEEYTMDVFSDVGGVGQLQIAFHLCCGAFFCTLPFGN